MITLEKLVKYVYGFMSGRAEGDASMKNLLGGKGANLAVMRNIKVPVPPGFTITTEACVSFYDNNEQWPESLWEEIQESVICLQQETGKGFGESYNPLLVSVRSGARDSMPGMMDTILNLGLNDDTVIGFADKTNEKCGWDSYRRFIQMYGDVVLEIEKKHFEEILEEAKLIQGVLVDSELSVESLQSIVECYKELVKKETGKDFPQVVFDQLRGAVTAVFRSWNNQRAIDYRKQHAIPAAWGTAVNVQTMVFGNMGETSATGVLFTRNPSTGENVIYGEFLPNAQGEDVVAGIRTPQPLSKSGASQGVSLEEFMPEAYHELITTVVMLERHFKDVVDIEFTIEDGKLYILQSRIGKRTGVAALKIAVDMVGEELITEREALMRVTTSQLQQVLHPILDLDGHVPIAKGLGASFGGAVGQVVFSASDAVEWSAAGKKVILVTEETSPKDFAGMIASNGMLTARGGATSHAALVARGEGKVAIVGCSAIHVYADQKQFIVNGHVVKEGDFISLDGDTGCVYFGKIKTKEPQKGGEYDKFMQWADTHAHLKVRANADTPQAVRTALKNGAVGVGLDRLEHNFFVEDRIDDVREMILAEDALRRRAALGTIRGYMRGDFIAKLDALDGYPITVRLLDPPLHEFLPLKKEEQEMLAVKLGIPVEKIANRVEELHESNPMLGNRGCRLGIVCPDITEMQVRAMLEAMVAVQKNGIEVNLEIMVPLVGHASEFEAQKAIINKVAQQIRNENEGSIIGYKVGTMIELPRACVTADKIAESAEFFSFGTNDLTQTALGMSRDDSGSFLPTYVEQGLLGENPFVSIDEEGVGELMKIAVEKGRKTRLGIKLGICGEQGGDPKSIDFCHRLGLDYVSCSQFRVPIARLAAAQAAIEHPRS